MLYFQAQSRIVFFFFLLWHMFLTNHFGFLICFHFYFRTWSRCLCRSNRSFSSVTFETKPRQMADRRTSAGKRAGHFSFSESRWFTTTHLFSRQLTLHFLLVFHFAKKIVLLSLSSNFRCFSEIGNYVWASNFFEFFAQIEPTSKAVFENEINVYFVYGRHLFFDKQELI